MFRQRELEVWKMLWQEMAYRPECEVFEDQN